MIFCLEGAYSSPGLVVGADEACPLPIGVVLHLGPPSGAGPPHAELRPQVPLVQVCLLRGVPGRPRLRYSGPKKEPTAKIASFR